MNADDVAAVWSEVLDGVPVGADDDFFFDLHGSSLLAVGIVSRLAAAAGLPLELRDLYLAPTPRDLADYLAELAGALAALRDRAGGRFDLDAFAEALTGLGSAAAESLLPAPATVECGDRPLSRVAALRRARGNGACTRVPGPDLVLRRDDDVLVRLDVSGDGPRLRFTELTADEAAGAVPG